MQKEQVQQITKLTNDDDEDIKHTDDIMKVIRNFYKSFYFKGIATKRKSSKRKIQRIF